MEENMSQNTVKAKAVGEDTIASQQLADVIPVTLTKAFDDDVGVLHAAAKHAEDARENHRRAFVDLCTKIYIFKKVHSEKEIADWLEAKGLKVTAKANDWTPVVKLAFAVKQTNGEWTVSNAQVNKYANVMRYAEDSEIAEGELAEWIGERTLTELIGAARLALRDDDGGDDDEPQVKITRYLNQLKETWQPFFEKGLPKAVDLTQAPVQAGKVQIMAEVDDKGNITPLGIMQVDQPKLLSLLAPPKSKTPLANDLRQSIVGVKKLYGFADFLPMSANIQRSIILDVAKDKWRMYVCEPNQWSCPIAEATFAQPHLQLPVGRWFLDSAKQKALSFLLNNFPAKMIAVSADNTHCRITIQDSETKTVEALIEEINERKYKSWQSAKAKKKTTATEPPTYDWPDGCDENVLSLPDASAMKVARLHRDVQWMDTGIAASKQFRNDLAHFCDAKTGDATFFRLRIGATQISFLRGHGGDPLDSVKYGKKARDGLEEFFSINKLVLSRAMKAMSFAIGNAPCQLSLSDGKTVLRLSAEHNGGEYNIYIPAIGLGYDYAGDEFSLGRLA
jgi:hypothetical protein